METHSLSGRKVQSHIEVLQKGSLAETETIKTAKLLDRAEEGASPSVCRWLPGDNTFISYSCGCDKTP